MALCETSPGSHKESLLLHSIHDKQVTKSIPSISKEGIAPSVVLLREWPVPVAQEFMDRRYSPAFSGKMPWKRGSVISKIQGLNTFWQRRVSVSLGRRSPWSFRDVQCSRQWYMLSTSGVIMAAPGSQLTREEML